MSQLITKYIADNAITGAKISSGGKQAVLESRLEGYRRGVIGFTPTITSDVVTTEVVAAAVNDSPVANLASKGIFTGTVGGITSVLRVIIYQTGTNQGVVDDNSDEVFGKLTEAGSVFTLTYFNADNTAFTGTCPDIDFYFVEVMDMFELPADANLYQGVTGVVDADQATTIGGHLNGGVNKHDASEIDVETAGNFTTVADLETNLGALDGAIQARALSSTVTEIDANADDLVTLSGVAENATDLGTFTGTTIPDAQTNKAALQALETALENFSGQTSTCELFTLDGTDITNKYVDLTSIPDNEACVQVTPIGGPLQDHLVDYDIITDGSDNKRLSWDSLGLDGVLESGDKIRVYYTVA